MENELYRAHPAMFRNSPLAFILTVALILVGIGLLVYGLLVQEELAGLTTLPLAGCLVCVGLLILLVWWIRVLGTTLTVTDKRTTLRKGILSRHTNEVIHANVRNIQISQTLLQRLFNVGKIGISSAGQSGIEIEVRGVPDPRQVKQLINQYRIE